MASGAIWRCLFGCAFYLVAMVSEGRLPTLRAFSFYMLISNAIGYSIHGLFRLGRVTGLLGIAKRGGFSSPHRGQRCTSPSVRAPKLLVAAATGAPVAGQ